MFRYVAWAWDPAQNEQVHQLGRIQARLTEQLPAYRTVFRSENLLVACADMSADRTAKLLPPDKGVVLGQTFKCARDPAQDEPMAPAQFNERDATQAYESLGESLIDSTWGDYVAILISERRVTFVTAATGSLPCLVDTREEILWAYSYTPDALALGARRYARSHAYTRAQVLGEFIDRTDPLEGQVRLLRGESFSVYEKPQRRTLWHPTRIAAKYGVIENANEAARIMRGSIIAATRTLTRAHAAVLLRLSGGLDSSIIAGCLRYCPTKTMAHTYVSRGTPSDARPWARDVASFCGFSVEQREIDPGTLSLAPLACLSHAPDAIATLEYVFRSELERELCRRAGATAIATGDGGDSGFCSESFALSALDYLRAHGPTPRFWLLAHRVARSAQRSLPTIAHRAIVRAVRGQRMRDQAAPGAEITGLVSPHLRHADLDQIPHPWFTEDREVRWDIWYRLGALVLPPQPYDLAARPEVFAPYLVQPLYAQPVVEALLRIPTYVHFEGGRDRGLARRAFSGDAPRANLERLWKDRAPGFLEALLDHNRSWLRETFLDGVLVRDQLLDRAKLEATLSSTSLKSDVLAAEVFHHLDTELWARHWDSAVSTQPSLART
jgi:asparagine synthase (glutamine-hydrolysing)